jgi:nitrogen fixation-related uncharacterized protein
MIAVVLIFILVAIAVIFFFAMFSLNKQFDDLQEQIIESPKQSQDLRGEPMSFAIVNSGDGSYSVNATITTGIAVTLKKFDSDDDRYNLQCAEELLDKLNENL